jgi:hypothetical protein
VGVTCEYSRRHRLAYWIFVPTATGYLPYRCPARSQSVGKGATPSSSWFQARSYYPMAEQRLRQGSSYVWQLHIPPDSRPQ